MSSVAHLLSAMKDAVEKMKEAREDKDLEKFAEAKREILSFQKKLDRML